MADKNPIPIAGRFPKAETAFVRAYARRSGLSISALVKASVREYIAARPVNMSVNASDSAVTPLATPQTKKQRNDSGKAESIPILQQMDLMRRANNAANKGFSD